MADPAQLDPPESPNPAVADLAGADLAGADLAGADPAGESLIGTRLGRYRVEEVIGSGGMSTLYRASDVRLLRPVALKVISPLLSGDEEFRVRFVDEARNTSAVDHPHVVPLYDHDEIDGQLYIAMRFLDGPNLAALVGRPLHPGRVLTLAGQVADALDAVHEHGLVHLDVKPANVLVAREAAGEHVYLADFGLTRRGNAGHLTSSGQFLGSPSYAAPEHLRGDPVDHRTDLYSLGCVLFTCLAGRAPYVGSIDTVVDGHLDGAPPPVGRLRQAVVPPAPVDPRLAVGAAVDEVLTRALALDPAARPASARELVAGLGKAMVHDAGHPVGPARSPAPTRAVTPPAPPAAAGATPGSPPAGETPRPPVGSPRPPAGETAGSPPGRVHAHLELDALRTREAVTPADVGPFTRRRPGYVVPVALLVVIAVLVLVVELLG